MIIGVNILPFSMLSFLMLGVVFNKCLYVVPASRLSLSLGWTFFMHHTIK